MAPRHPPRRPAPGGQTAARSHPGNGAMTSGHECWRTPGEGERAGSGDSGHGPRFRADTPYPARACHYRLLDGKDHHPACREPAEDLTWLRPGTGPTAPANRCFLARAVHHFAGRGIRQFLHIGKPLPHPAVPTTSPSANKHLTAGLSTRATACLPGAHARAQAHQHLRRRLRLHRRRPAKTPPPSSGEAARTLDLAKPVAVLLLAVLHLIPPTPPAQPGSWPGLASALAPGQLHRHLAPDRRLRTRPPPPAGPATTRPPSPGHRPHLRPGPQPVRRAAPAAARRSAHYRMAARPQLAATGRQPVRRRSPHPGRADVTSPPPQTPPGRRPVPRLTEFA